jgi:hypothetical protein
MSAEKGSRLSRYIQKSYREEIVRAFVPPLLPPAPPVRLDGLQRLLEQANQSLSRLDGLASVLPGLDLLIYTYVRKEAVLSSQIEGMQSSLSDLLLFENNEAPGVPLADVQGVSNYVAALNSRPGAAASRISALATANPGNPQRALIQGPRQ